MPFIPHTEEAVREMLRTIGVNGIEDLFDEVPDNLRCGSPEAVSAGLSEMEVFRLMADRARLEGRRSTVR